MKTGFPIKIILISRILSLQYKFIFSIPEHSPQTQTRCQASHMINISFSIIIDVWEKLSVINLLVYIIPCNNKEIKMCIKIFFSS